MLYVNLIEERLKGRAVMGAVIRFGALGLAAVVVLMGILLFLQLLRARDLGRKIEAARNEVKQLEPKAEDSKAVIVELVEINPLWRLTDDVTISQQTWGMVLRAVSECRPMAGVISIETVDSHAAEKDKTVRVALRGVATNEFAVSDYQMALNNYIAVAGGQPLFDAKATKLNEVVATPREGMSVRTFGLELGLSPPQEGVASVPE